MIVPVFKTGGWQAILSLVGSTPTRFRHFSITYRHQHQAKITHQHGIGITFYGAPSVSFVTTSHVPSKLLAGACQRLTDAL